MSEMQGIETPVTARAGTIPVDEHKRMIADLAARGFKPYDLAAPFQTPLVPRYTPLRDWQYHTPPPRYVPGPLPDDAARVHLSDDYYLGPVWGDYHPQNTYSPDSVFDIPAEQRDRWQAAMDAYIDMQAEIEMLMDARRRNPEPAKRGPYTPQP